MIGQLLNNELERMLKEEVVASFHLLGAFA
jgi:hypothetical protein